MKASHLFNIIADVKAISEVISSIIEAISGTDPEKLPSIESRLNRLDKHCGELRNRCDELHARCDALEGGDNG